MFDNGTIGTGSTTRAPTQAAVKTYVDTATLPLNYVDIDTASPYETSVGYQAGNAATGLGNSFFGYYAGSGATTQNYNTGVGYYAIQQSKGSDITAVGYQAHYLSWGDQNTAVGSGALRGVAGGGASRNVAIGKGANYMGYGNCCSVSVGYNALYSMGSQSGYEFQSFNTAIGQEAMRDTTRGTSNVSLGYQSMSGAQGNSNTAIGPYTLQNITDGNYNTAVGRNAGINVIGASSSNVFIGYNAGPSTATTISNQLYIDNASGTPLIFGDFSTNRVGINRIATTYNLEVQGTAGKTDGTTTWAVISDERLKDIDGKLEYGLDEILKLNTVRFHYKENNPVGMDSEAPQMGVIAQDIMTVMPEAVSMRPDGYYDLNVDPIHWASINAIQELNNKCEMTKDQMAKIDQRISRNERDIASLKIENDNLKKENAAIKAYLCSKDPGASICK